MIHHRDVINHRVLIVEPFGKEGLELLQQKTQVDIRLQLTPKQLAAILPQYHALIVRSGTRVDETLLEAGKNLIVIGRAGVGVDNIDLAAATRRGIVVVNAPTTNIVAVAEHTLALLWTLARKIPQADRSLREGKWTREAFVGSELVGKQLGLIGLGRVGSHVARLAVGIGMEVVAFDPYVSAERAAQMQVRMVSLDELLATSDFISLHTPLTPETRKLLGPQEFSKMKRGARLINTARGALLDEDALLTALETGHLAGAALDVFESEPPQNPRLLTNPRLVLTPHLGGSTEEAATRVSLETAGEVLAVLEGRPARFAVNAPLVSPSLASFLRPYLDLAERLGRFYIQWVGGPLDDIEIEYAGSFAGEDTSALTAAVIKGLLEPIHEARVNLVNAALVAQMHGLRYAERKTQARLRYDNVISVKGVRRVAGAILHDEPHIIQLDGYAVDFIPQGYLLLTRHRDRPGMIGKVGTLLGNADVNIASMQVARDAPRGEAIMVLNLDDPVPPEVIKQLQQVTDIQWSKVLHL